jgi:hypothetical protein
MPSCCGNPYKHLGRAQDLTYTLLRTLRSIANGNGAGVTEITLRERLEICAACEEKRGLRCQKCGCFVSVKAALFEAECPLQKWPLPRR